MNKLRVVGYAPGIQNVVVIKAIREHCGTSLDVAKQLFDGLMLGASTELNFRTVEDRRAFMEVAKRLGLTVDVVDS